MSSETSEDFIWRTCSADNLAICSIFARCYPTRITKCGSLCAEVQQFVDNDPYIEGGLVTKVTIRPVAAAVGTWVTSAKK